MIELEFISPQIGLYFNILYVVKLRQSNTQVIIAQVSPHMKYVNKYWDTSPICSHIRLIKQW
jgi:hypothetical protein